MRTRTCSPSRMRMTPPRSDLLPAEHPAAECDAREARDEAYEHGCRDVPDRDLPGPALRVADRLVVERRVRREPSHHARGERETQRGGEERRREADLHQDAEQEGA